MGHSSKGHKLKCLYANLQSLLNKKREIEIKLLQVHIDIMFFTEVWVDESIDNSEYFISGFQKPILDFNNRGGTCVYFREGLQYTEVLPPNNVNESNWFCMKTSDNISRLYACIYRSPNSDDENNENLLRNISWAHENYTEVVIVGDMNIPSINWENDTATTEYGRRFVDCVNDNYLEQLIEHPTRYRHGNNPSLLDLILTSDPDIVSSLEYRDPFGKCDHVSLYFEVNNKVLKESETKYRYNYSKLNLDIFATVVTSMNWEDVIANSDLNCAYNLFVATVNRAINDSTPIIKVKSARQAPWSNRNIERLSKRKRDKWDKYRHTGEARHYNEYKQVLNDFNEEKLISVLNHENNVIASKNTDAKKYYKYVSFKNKYKKQKIAIKSGDEIETDDKRCAILLNQHFGSVFTKGASIKPDFSPSPDIDVMEDVEFTEELIRKKVNELNVNKACGPDQIPGSVLKKCEFVLVPILLIFFQISYSSGIVPDKMKEASVVALFKSGDRGQPNNYRPVSLTPIITKIFESIMHDNLIRHIETNSLINKCQHGFRKNHSTCSNLVYFWNDITKFANNKQEITIIYTDLRKAFDSVPHDLLLYKLSKLGIANKNLQWFSSFLDNRHQSVSINNVSSSSIQIDSGVPQGGVLSGTLFNLYINDMPEELNYLKASLYADDAKLYAPIMNSDSERQIQEDIDRVVDWCNRWRLRLNVSKCFFLHYKPNKLDGNYPNYHMGNDELQRRQNATDLGVIICDDLKLHDQVNKACKEATRQINIIRRTFVSRNPEFLSNMFKSHIRPKLEYCVPMWNPVYAGDVGRMEKVQNRFTRLLLHGRTMTPAERNEVLGLTTHKIRRLRGDLIQVFKMAHDTSLFPRPMDARTRGHSKKLLVQPVQNNIRKHSLALRSVRVWNELPEEVVNAESMNIFKARLDLFLNQNVSTL